MFLYPLLWQYIPMLKADARLMGIYTGCTVHELAGVVAAGGIFIYLLSRLFSACDLLYCARTTPTA
jgi:uncharacterized membrane protein YadS